MRFSILRLQGPSTGFKIAAVAVGWLILISALHYKLNYESSRRDLVRMGYMPVIANLSAPLLDYATREGQGVRFEAFKFSSFADMGEALRNGDIQAAFIIAPLSIVLHQQGAGVRIVYIGNRHESTLVYRKDLQVKSFADLAGKSIAVPLRYSGHNLATRRLADQFGVTGPNLNIVEMNPPDMAPALISGSLDAYFVGEPFAVKSVHAGAANVLYYVEEVWPDFICNLTVVRKDWIESSPDRAQLFVQSAIRAGLWAKDHPKEAGEIVAKYWNQPAEFVTYVLTSPPNRVVYDKYLPKEDEIRYLADQMVRFKLLERNDISGLVDDRFARQADLSGITDFPSVVKQP